MLIRSTILAQIKDVANEQGKRLVPLTDDVALLECGLDSLCLAVLIVRLEECLGCDPFSELGAHAPLTVGDFIRAYEAVDSAASGQSRLPASASQEF